MQDQPRDEARAATVREGGNESWSEAAEMIDRPDNLPTAAGSRTPGGDVPPGAGEATSGHTSTATRQRPSTSAPGSQVESEHPTGSSFSSSDAPAGQGSNTPVGDEPDRFRDWDAHQPPPGPDSGGFASMLPSMPSMSSMPSKSSMGGLVGSAVIGGLGYTWWRRRQARNTRTARMQAALTAFSGSAGSELPRMIGQAAAQSKSAWLPLMLLPIGLWLRERGKEGERASEQLLKPLELDKRSEQLSRQGMDLLESYRRRLIDDVDPNQSSGPGWMTWLFGGALVGGGYYAYRQGWIGAIMPSNSLSSSPTRTMVRDVMTRGVETVTPDATIADVARRMRDLDVGSLPVTEGNRLLGIVTDRDLSVRATAAAKDPNTTKVREVMSPELAWIFEDEPADAAARVMRDRQIRRLPVLDRSDRLVGMVALADLATDLGDDRLKGETLEEISQPSGSARR